MARAKQDKTVTAYGVTFPNMAALCRALGFKRQMSPALVSQYGGLDEMIKKRLQATDPDQIRDILTEKAGAEVSADSPGTMVAKMVIRKCLGNTQADSVIVECATLAGVVLDADGVQAVQKALEKYRLSLSSTDLII